jgi:hypothetical protein
VRRDHGGRKGRARASSSSSGPIILYSSTFGCGAVFCRWWSSTTSDALLLFKRHVLGTHHAVGRLAIIELGVMTKFRSACISGWSRHGGRGGAEAEGVPSMETIL